MTYITVNSNKQTVEHGAIDLDAHEARLRMLSRCACSILAFTVILTVVGFALISINWL